MKAIKRVKLSVINNASDTTSDEDWNPSDDEVTESDNSSSVDSDGSYHVELGSEEDSMIGSEEDSMIGNNIQMEEEEIYSENEDDWEDEEDDEEEIVESYKERATLYDELLNDLSSLGIGKDKGKLTKLIEKQMNEMTHNLDNKKFLEYVSKIPTLDPSLNEILTCKIKEKDRIKLCESYIIMVNQQIHSLEWIQSREYIKKYLETSKKKYQVLVKFSDEQRQSFKTEVERMKNIIDVPLKERIICLDTSDETKITIYKKYKEMKEYPHGDLEASKLQAWLKFALSVPYNIIKPIYHMDNSAAILSKVYQGLENEIYGLKEVKEQIMLFINSKMMSPEMKGCNIALVGPPGTGKSRLSRCLANVMDFPFEQISFGGITTPEVLNGHDYTYVGSRPGLFVKKIVNMGCKNGILYMDEFEKITNPDVTNMLLQITDPTQNTDYTDNFLGGDIKIDMSMMWFIYSMNMLPTSGPLTDRLFVINIPGYTREEKICILKDYVLPCMCKNINLNRDDITITEKSARYFIDRVSNDDDKGIRTIERNIRDVVNKIAFLVNNKDIPVSFSCKQKLSYPVNLDNSLIESFVRNKNVDERYKNLYI